MAIKYYVENITGVYLGEFDGLIPPNSTEVPTKPDDSSQIWLFPGWSPFTAPKEYKIYEYIPDFVGNQTIFPSIYTEKNLTTQLYQVHTAFDGVLLEPTETIFYASASAGTPYTYSDPVMKKTYNYTNPDVVTIQIQYYYKDGTLDGLQDKIEEYVLADNPPEVVKKQEDGTLFVGATLRNVVEPTESRDISNKAYVDALSGFANAYAVFEDQKPTGANGGTFTAGAWRTRDLNTEVVNLITGCVLSANQITLNPGKYYIEWFAPAHSNVAAQNEHASRCWDLTGLQVLAYSNSNTVTKDLNDFSEGRGYFELFVPSVIEIQHQIETTVGSDGFGHPSSLAAFEVYTRMSLWRLSENV
jgi:hypothetical protein